MNQKFDYVLLDLGGVLVELKGWDQLLIWSRFETLIELKRHWIISPTVRRFETGRCSEQEFGENLVRELSLKVDATEFLAAFEQWIHALYPETNALLTELSANVPIVSISNTSTLHWRRVKQWNFLHHFTHNFPSFEIGIHKPNSEYFRHVLFKLQIPAYRALLYDDTLANVQAARLVGITAELVAGPDQLRESLKRHGLLSKP